MFLNLFFSTSWKNTVGGFVNQLINKFWPYFDSVCLHCELHQILTLYLLMLSAANFCKQYGPRSDYAGPTEPDLGPYCLQKSGLNWIHSV